MEVCGNELGVTPSVCGDGRDRDGGGGYLFHPSTEHNTTLNNNQSNHGSMYGDGAAPWGKGLQEAVGKLSLDLVGARLETERTQEVEEEKDGSENGRGTGKYRGGGQL